MIELFDAERLLPQRDRSLSLVAAALLLAAGTLGGYGWTLQTRLQGVERQRAELQLRLQQAPLQSWPSGALLADLQRQAERLEVESGVEPATATEPIASPSIWMQRLAGLGSSDISLSKIELDRTGALRIEGMAASAQAVTRLVQAWDQAQPAGAPLPLRAIELRQDPTSAPLLRFKLRASARLTKARP